MKYVESTPRNQIHLYSQCIDEMVGADNPVRFIDLYGDELDLEKLGFRVVDNATGRPPFDPRMMIKLYMYGYLQRIRTSRRLERECERNIELIWLTGDLRPDFHTIGRVSPHQSQSDACTVSRVSELLQETESLETGDRWHRRHEGAGTKQCFQRISEEHD